MVLYFIGITAQMASKLDAAPSPNYSCFYHNLRRTPGLISMGGMRSIFYLLPFFCLTAEPAIVARVNGDPITTHELELALKKSSKEAPVSQDAVLERLILYKLAVQKARESKIADNALVKQEIDQILYKHFLKNASKEAALSLEPNNHDVSELYKERPLVRIRHLVRLLEGEKDKAHQKQFLSSLKKRLNKTTSFKALVLRYSQDESAKFAGDLDYRGYTQLPAPLYQAAIKMKPGEISPVIELPDSLHLIELIAIQPFGKAPETYRRRLRAELYRERETKFLKAHLEKLRKEASIEILAKGKKE